MQLLVHDSMYIFDPARDRYTRVGHAFLKALGADEVVDYHDESWPEKVNQLTNGQLKHAFGCISEQGLTPNIAKAMSREG